MLAGIIGSTVSILLFGTRYNVQNFRGILLESSIQIMFQTSALVRYVLNLPCYNCVSNILQDD